MEAPISKRYTIKYSKSGINQYADFIYQYGTLVYNTFNPSYTKKEEIPSLEGITDIQDILNVIKAFSYNNRAEIYLIDGVFPEYYENKVVQEDIELIEDNYQYYINSTTLVFFKKHLLPELRKKRWKITYSWAGYPVLIKKNKKEWVNVDSKESRMVDFICYEYVRQVTGGIEPLELESETGHINNNGFMRLFNLINKKDLEKLKILINLD